VVNAEMFCGATKASDQHLNCLQNTLKKVQNKKTCY
jgi:hypothetical protein